MRFHLSDDQEMICDSLRRTVAGLAERRRAVVDGADPFDRESWSALMAAGLGGMMLPEAYGGSGMGLLDAALALECVGEAALPGPFLGQLIAGLAFSQSPDTVLKARWLTRIGDGSATAMAIIRCPEASPADWPRRDGAGLVGTAHAVPGAVQANLIVMQLADGDIVLVETGPAIEIVPVAGSDATRGLVRVGFDQAPYTTLALDEHEAARLLDAALVLLAADALGGAGQCLALAVDYAKLREQFGQPIGAFQAVKHQLAHMALAVEPARALLWYAAHAWDVGSPDARRAAAHAKAHLCDRFVAVARAAIEVHGGIGYTWEHVLHIWFRRSLHDRAYLGQPSVHRERAAMFAGW